MGGAQRHRDHSGEGQIPDEKPTVEGHVKILTMHFLIEMEQMVFYSLEELNQCLLQKVREENQANFEGLSYLRQDLFEKEEKKTLLPLPPTRFEYPERKTVKVAQDFFTFDTVHYTIPRKYLKQELEIRAGEKEIYIYDKHEELIRVHTKRYKDDDFRYLLKNLLSRQKGNRS